MKNQIMWVCGQVNPESKKEKEWDLHGVFDSEEKAIKECHGYNFFIGPVELNKPFPVEPVEWLGAYYPSEKKEGEPVE